jgi:RimJ/RimL family protein N-acetyltransferase/8-oxo-dGTP pyrophosphatase MutT (NUDIX family)
VAVEVRRGVRAVLLDPDDRILLVRFVNPDDGRVYWATPGGGVEEGEDDEACLRRELLEETGLERVEIGPALWTRREVFPWAGRTLDQSETLHLVRVPRFEPRPTIALGPEGISELRWWTLPELEASDEEFVPRGLAGLLRSLEPRDLGLEMQTERLRLVVFRPGLPLPGEDAREILDELTHPGGWGAWLVLRGDEVVGDAGFRRPPAGGEVELGYSTLPEHRGRGYATEAAAALVEWALAQPGVERVVADPEPGNEASIRVLEKLGMRRLDERRWAKP